MHLIMLKADTLDQENRRFEQQPLAEPVFLNSLPKSGSHLLRNIMRMFVPVSQQYQRQFIQHRNLQQHLGAFDRSLALLSWGHLPFSDDAAVAVEGVRKIQLVRDPYDWVIARARFFVSDEVQGTEFDLLKSGKLSVNELLSLMIFGIHGRAPGMLEMYTHHCIAWTGAGVHLLRYEDLVAHIKDLESEAADSYFARLLEECGIERPSDWQERVTVGSDRSQSGTARENLTTQEVAFPDRLPDEHRRLVDFAAPGLRAFFGYA